MPGSTSAASSSRMPLDADSLRHGGEIRVLELGTKIEEAGRFLLELDEAKRAIVEHHDLHRQAELGEAEEIAHEHGEAAIARERNHLAFRERRLCADRLRHRVRHRAMPERRDQPALAVHREIARCPNRRQSDIAGEHGIFVCQIAQCLGDLLRVDELLAGPTDRQFVETTSHFFVMLDGSIEAPAILFLLQQRKQSIEA